MGWVARFDKLYRLTLLVSFWGAITILYSFIRNNEEKAEWFSLVEKKSFVI